MNQSKQSSQLALVTSRLMRLQRYVVSAIFMAAIAACGGGGGSDSNSGSGGSGGSGGTGGSSGGTPPAATTAQVRTVNALDEGATTTLWAGEAAMQSATVEEPVTEFASMTTVNAPQMSVSVQAETSVTANAKPESMVTSSASSLSMSAQAGDKITVIAAGDSKLITPLSVKQNNAALTDTQTGVRVLHAAARVPEVDIYVSAPNVTLPSSPTIGALAFTKFSPAVDQPSLVIPSGNYQIRITLAGQKDVVFDSGSVALPGGQDVLIVAIPSFESAAPVSLLLLPRDSKPTLVRTKAASLRAVHLSPDAPAVDLIAASSVVARDVQYRESTRNIRIAPGAVNVKVNATGTSNTVINANLTASADQSTTVLAVNRLAAIEPVVIVDDGKAAPKAKAKLRVTHAAPAVPAVDVYLTAPDAALPTTPTLPALAFKQVVPASGSAALEVEAGNYRVRITLAGQRTPVYDSGPFSVRSRDSVLLAAVAPKAGAPAQPSPVDLLAVRTHGQNQLIPSKQLGGSPNPQPASSVQVRAFHASPQAPAVDVLVDGTKTFSSLAYSRFSEYKSAPAGQREFKVNVSSSGATALTAPLTLEADSTYTVVAFNTPAQLRGLLLKDQRKSPAVGARGYIRFVNLVQGTQGDVTFSGGSTAGAQAYGTASSYGEASMGVKAITARFNSADGQDIKAVAFNLDQGLSYTVYAIGSTDKSVGQSVKLLVSKDAD